MPKPGQRNARGFTRVELLVVMAIIGMMVGLLLPAVQYARGSARRSQCLSNLHQIGIAMESYLDVQGSRGKYPVLCAMPSVCDKTAQVTGVPRFLTLREVLAPYIEESLGAFNCPSDVLLDEPPDLRYFEREQQSYEYDSQRKLVDFVSEHGYYRGLTRQEVEGNGASRGEKLSTTFLAHDYDNFHGPEGSAGRRCILFADGHAEAP